MTTVILLIIGILIAAVAALMMYFWGGDAYNESHVKAEAARLVTEGGQLESAVSLYQIQEGELPGDGVGLDDKAMQDLISKKYLTHRPAGARDKDGTPRVWTVDYDMGIIRTTVGPAEDGQSVGVCLQARKQLRLAAASTPSGVYQCDGSDYPGNPGGLPGREPCCIASNVPELAPTS
ncbi:hypothetical protein [Sphingomonas sp. 3-13AW]|uniref:hypothetical protein n=1 Tax=Sphingomonas sp. 3-13AW TaxID=3050450 RepID=UPI003BB77151